MEKEELETLINDKILETYHKDQDYEAWSPVLNKIKELWGDVSLPESWSIDEKYKYSYVPSVVLGLLRQILGTDQMWTSAVEIGESVSKVLGDPGWTIEYILRVQPKAIILKSLDPQWVWENKGIVDSFMSETENTNYKKLLDLYQVFPVTLKQFK